MVATVEDILGVIRSNPFIDGIGYFVEVTTTKKLPSDAARDLTDRVRGAFCAHSQVSVEGEDVLGLDFHEHIYTQGENADEDLAAVEKILRHIESVYGIDHLCIELQFDLARARTAKKHMDELLKP